MPNLMVVGQQEFISTVEKPHSKKLNAFVHKYMKFHVLNLFRQVPRRSACELHFLPFFCRSFRLTMNFQICQCPKKPATIKTHQVQTMLWRQPYLQVGRSGIV